MNRSSQAHLPVNTVTHPGMTGKNNEDRYAVSAYRLRGKHATPALLAVLADGIGGHRAGEVAAEIAVETISREVGASNAGDPAQILQRAIHAANQEIHELSQADANRRGMGATCVCVWVIGRRLYAATVGDSRLYLLRGGAIRQLSTDHTWVQEALDQGLLQPEQVAGHPNAHVIRRYLGAPTPPEVDFRLRLDDNENNAQAVANQGVLLEPGDRLLLCSDGLTDMVDDSEILGAFQALPQDSAVNQLMTLANQRGGLDNITLVAIAVPASRRAALFGRQRAGSAQTRTLWGCIGLAALALLAAGLVFAAIWFVGDGLRTPTSTPQPTAKLLETRPVILPTRAAPTKPITVTPPGPEVFGTPPPAPTFAPRATLTAWPTNTLPPLRSPAP